MARRDDVHEFVQNNCEKPKEDENKDLGNNKSSKLSYIPEGTALVYTDLNGSVKVIVGPAWPKIEFPWRINFEYIDLKEKQIDYPARVYHTKDFIKINTDIYIKIKVVDPRKRFLGSQNFEETLFNFIQEKVMNYFQKFTQKELEEIKNESKINIDKIGANEFKELEEKYGVKLTSIGTTKFNFPDLEDEAKIQVENLKRHEERMRELDRRKKEQKEQREIKLFDTETENQVKRSEVENLFRMVAAIPQNIFTQMTEFIKADAMKNWDLTSYTHIDSQGIPNIPNIPMPNPAQTTEQPIQTAEQTVQKTGSKKTPIKVTVKKVKKQQTNNFNIEIINADNSVKGKSDNEIIDVTDSEIIEEEKRKRNK